MDNGNQARDIQIEIPNKSPKIELNESLGIPLDRKTRFLLFFLLTGTNILINMDHGTIPAASNEIKSDLNITDTTLGTFGSLVYLGSFVGALVLMKLIDIINRKILVVASVIINAALIFSFTQVKFIIFLFANRILVGIMQAVVTVYYPVWVDQFGPRPWKTVMISIFNVTSPLGVVMGYILTMIIKRHYDVGKINLVEALLYDPDSSTMSSFASVFRFLQSSLLNDSVHYEEEIKKEKRKEEGRQAGGNQRW